MMEIIRLTTVASARRRFAWLMVAALGLGAAPALASGAMLRERATVDAAEWRLADVADLSGIPEPLARSLGRQVVWPSPPPCRSARVSRLLIGERLHELSHGASDRLELGGAAAIEIERRCQPLDLADAQGVARETLAAWLAPRSARFELESEPVPGRIELPVGRVTMAPRALPADASPASRMQVWVDVRVDDVFVRTVPLAFRVRAFREAWVATRDARPGEPPADAALERREIDIAGVPAGALADVPARFRLKRPLLSGQVLTPSHVEPLPSVQRGAFVTVRSALGAIAIEARGEALQDGAPGELVWVRLATSTGPIHGRVVGAGVVEVRDE